MAGRTAACGLPCPQLGGSSEASPSLPPPAIQHRKARLTRPFLVLQPCSHSTSLNPCASLYVHKIWILLCTNFLTLWFAIHSNTSNLKNHVSLYVSTLNTMSYLDLGFYYCICQLNQYIYKNKTEVLSYLPYQILNSHPLSFNT